MVFFNDHVININVLCLGKYLTDNWWIEGIFMLSFLFWQAEEGDFFGGQIPTIKLKYHSFII